MNSFLLMKKNGQWVIRSPHQARGLVADKVVVVGDMDEAGVETARACSRNKMVYHLETLLKEAM